ncbi:MAG TPA: hypothetical protein VF306_16805 [Pirellulales bacterium]
MLKKNEQYSSGWINTTIHDFLADGDFLPAYALVTCMDSSFDIEGVAKADASLRELYSARKIRFVGTGMLVRTRELLAAEQRKRLFFGFDEVWFCSRPPLAAKPKKLVIVGPNRIAPQLLGKLAAWMQANHCTLGLGDGVGLNFCAQVSGLARHLIEALSESVVQTDRDERPVAIRDR